MSNSRKQIIYLVIGIVFVAAIMAVKFLAGNMLTRFLMDFLTIG